MNSPEKLERRRRERGELPPEGNVGDGNVGDGNVGDGNVGVGTSTPTPPPAPEPTPEPDPTPSGPIVSDDRDAADAGEVK